MARHQEVLRTYKQLIVLIGFCSAVLPGCVGTASTLSLATTTPEGVAERIPAVLTKPDGPGPFPAVVIVHDCSGLGVGSSGAPNRWTWELVSQGYAVLVPDSFTTRGHPGGVCTESPDTSRNVNIYRRATDAYATLAYLRTLPYVDGRRVGIMGGSHGGSTTLAAMYEPATETGLLAQEKRTGFAAGVALYPACANRFGQWHVARQFGSSGPITGYFGVYKPIAPLLILIGEKDDWTPAEPCKRLARAAQEAGYPVELKVYPGASHSFDSPHSVRYVSARRNTNSSTGWGATTGGDPQAWADSIRQVVAFFARHLK